MTPAHDDDLPGSAEERRATVQFTRKQAAKYYRALLRAEYGVDDVDGTAARSRTAFSATQLLKEVLDPTPLCVGMAPHPRATGPACCDRAGEYNGFASGPLVFTCPRHCMCHD